MTIRTIRRIALGLLLAALCCIIGSILVILNPTAQRYGLSRISQAIGYDLNTGTIRVSLGIKPGIRIQDIEILTKQGKVLLSAAELTLVPNLSDLFRSGSGTFISGAASAGNLKFQLDASGEIKNYTLPQAIFQGDYDLKKRQLQIASLRIITPETTLSTTGRVLLSPIASPYLDLNVSSPFMTVDTLKSLLPAMLLPEWILHHLLPAIRQGDIRIDNISLRGSLKQIETLNLPERAAVLGLNLTLRSLALHLPEPNAPEFRDLSGALVIKDGSLWLNDLSGRFWQSAIQNASVSVPNIYADRLHYRVSTEASLALSDVDHLKELAIFPVDVQQQIQTLQVIGGSARVRVSAEYETGQAFPKIITSAISLQSIQVTHPLLRLPLTVENASIDSAPDQPIQFSGRGLWGNSEFQIQGSADSTGRHLLAKATTRADVGQLIELALPHASIGKWIYGPLVAEGMLDDEGFTLDPARITAGKGYLRFKGRQAYRSDTGMHWIGYIHIVQEPAKNLLHLLDPGSNLQLDGTVLLEGLLTLKASDGTGRFSGLNGHARLVVENGWIQQSDPILKALSLISLERIFKAGSRSVQDGRLYFDRIDADFEIEEGKILVQSLTFQSPAINASAAGTIDLNRNQIQMKIGLQPLGTLDSIVNNIPLIGNILTGKDKSLVVDSLEVTGSLSNPQIKSVPLKNIGETTLGYIERMVFTPERILKSLTGLKNPRPPAPDYSAEFDSMAPSP